METASLLPLDSLDIFATASLRQVSKPGPAVEAIQASCGKKVEVLSGGGGGPSVLFGGGGGTGRGERGFLVDLGGGSTELVAFDRGRIVEACSLSMGCLSLFRRHVSFPLPHLGGEGGLSGRGGPASWRPGGPFPWERPAMFAVGGTARAACRLAGRFFCTGRGPGGADRGAVGYPAGPVGRDGPGNVGAGAENPPPTGSTPWCPGCLP